MKIQRFNRVAVLAVLGAGLLLAANLAMQPPPAATSPAEPPDSVCDTLFREYACGTKINSDVREAAIVLIASRGRMNGFWRTVVQKLHNTDDEQTETSCVRILSRMLAVDGRGREILAEEKRTGKEYAGQWGGPYVLLDESVVAELLSKVRRLRDGRDYRFIDYVRALADARDPQAREILLEVVRTGDEFPPGGFSRYVSESRMTAAVGLARLGEPAGVEWLIRNCESHEALLDRRSLQQAYDQLGDECRKALREISDDWAVERSTKADWETWWQSARAKFGNGGVKADQKQGER